MIRIDWYLILEALSNDELVQICAQAIARGDKQDMAERVMWYAIERRMTQIYFLEKLSETESVVFSSTPCIDELIDSVSRRILELLNDDNLENVKSRLRVQNQRMKLNSKDGVLLRVLGAYSKERIKSENLEVSHG